MEMSLAGQCPAVIWSVAEKGAAPAHLEITDWQTKGYANWHWSILMPSPPTASWFCSKCRAVSLHHRESSGVACRTRLFDLRQD